MEFKHLLSTKRITREGKLRLIFLGGRGNSWRRSFHLISPPPKAFGILPPPWKYSSIELRSRVYAMNIHKILVRIMRLPKYFFYSYSNEHDGIAKLSILDRGIKISYMIIPKKRKDIRFHLISHSNLSFKTNSLLQRTFELCQFGRYILINS